MGSDHDPPVPVYGYAIGALHGISGGKSSSGSTASQN
jgi:hypothetical protein